VDVHALQLCNLALHVGAGLAGIGLGIAMLVRDKGTRWHRQRGRQFAICVLIVGGTAAFGSAMFRFMPMFVVLTVLTIYQVVSGWRAVRNREAGPGAFDAAWTAVAIVATAALLPILLSAPPTSNSKPVVVFSTLGALAAILAYDAVRWLFPRRWFATLWIYEHVYKLVSSFAALLSAFAGNVIRWGQPWSQLLPSVLGTALIVYFFVRLARGGIGSFVRGATSPE
jgi:uncharacterized membrane protein